MMFPASRLLLREDDPEVASLYNRVLQEKGHKVTVVRTADRSLKIYSKSLHMARMKKIFSEMFNLMMRLFLIIKCRTETD